MEPIRQIAPLPTLYRDAHLTLDFQRQSATLDVVNHYLFSPVASAALPKYRSRL